MTKKNEEHNQSLDGAFAILERSLKKDSYDTKIINVDKLEEEKIEKVCCLEGDVVKTDGAGVEYIEHKIVPEDSLFGLELRYGVCASKIRMMNGMCTDRLNGHVTLKIPTDRSWKPSGASLVVDSCTNENASEMSLRMMKSSFPGHSEKELKSYLAEANGDLGDAVRACEEDLEWERSHKNESHRKKSLKKGRSSHRSSPGGIWGWFGWFGAASQVHRSKETFVEETTEDEKEKKYNSIETSSHAQAAYPLLPNDMLAPPQEENEEIISQSKF